MSETLSTHGASLLGITTLLLAVIMLFTFPSRADLPDGFRTPIIAFEFARSEADLSYLAGTSSASQRNRQMMDAGHQWDMAFPFAYGGFIAMLLLHMQSRGHRISLLGIPLALAIIPFDIHENLVLLNITSALAAASPVTELLAQLHTATWLKWAALGASIAVLAICLFRAREFLFAVVAFAAALSVAACGALDSQPVAAEAMSAVISLFFLVFTVRACIRSWTLLRQTTG